MQFHIAGTPLDLTREEVVRRIRMVEPDPVHTHAVEIEGEIYPVKQAFAVAASLDLLDFNTNQARSVLRRLGFSVTPVAS